ncbi:phosphoribosyl-AMP cyclohydrolase [bacterium BMS3Abin07]|nr:phosphoribosyl-AMP cyclohydrolase [bacterium BMS3Abin07]GBE31385.1 phosphoribosyl-AMP cyclohydrolase [bacterium BMS3Bbin05]HDL19694.1 phosphoribosyl-AMP cyclohydrolase [Nitrospirota bacterium]HDO21352.1 phosphoribosyl-AMP cyclohydrolase [Nitrospirota bacterium]HDZ87366.1 phosphoribosyl-AMP cyclohydrolase [Nitrospirota bacterium]
MFEKMKYDDKGLVPAIIQDAGTGEILMMAYMNEKSLRKTVETGFTHFWSRSRQKYWKKGETSGHVQEVREILVDCDEDTVLIKVIQHGPGACHTGHRSCFYRDIHGREIAEKTFSEEKVYGKKDN